MMDLFPLYTFGFICPKTCLMYHQTVRAYILKLLQAKHGQAAPAPNGWAHHDPKRAKHSA